jgi:uncharacterized membrane protein YoaK (UPF0700 family)
MPPGNVSIKSSQEKDDTACSFLASFTGMAILVAFLYPAYGLAAVCVVLAICVVALHEIWRRAEAIRFMMELKLDREGMFRR